MTNYHQMQIFRKKTLIMNIIKNNENNMELSFLISQLTDFMPERKAKELIKNMVIQNYIKREVSKSGEYIISVTKEGETYSNSIRTEEK